MSRFQRPQFTAPKIPKPPKAFAQLLPIIAIVQGVLPIVARVRGISLTTSFFVNAGLAQLMANRAAIQQRLMKLEIVNKARKRMQNVPIPPALQVDPREVLAYAQEMRALAQDPRAALEGRVRSAVDEFGQAARAEVNAALE